MNYTSIQLGSQIKFAKNCLSLQKRLLNSKSYVKVPAKSVLSDFLSKTLEIGDDLWYNVKLTYCINTESSDLVGIQATTFVFLITSKALS